MADELEKSMIAPQEEDTRIKIFNSPSADSIEAALSQLINLNPENILHEPTCMICSDPNRTEIEKKWTDTKNYDDTKSFFKTRSSASISNDVIENHMRFHYDRGVKELQKIEYINRIKRLSNVELTTLDRIRMALATIDERLAGINSITPSGDLSAAEVEEIKCSETTKLMSSYNNLLKLKISITGEMKESGELIIIPKQSFIDVFNIAIAEASNNEEKNVLRKVLTSLFEINKKTQ